jgi:undecaprenyl-diphosphatase
MTLLVALALAVIQGLTEYLPISSSGHLRLFGAWFGLSEPQTLFDVLLHAGTLAATLVFYRKELGSIAVGLWSWLTRRASLADAPFARLGLLVALGSVPTAALGLLFGHWVEYNLSAPAVVGALLLVNGAMLWSTKARLAHAGEGRGLKEVSPRDVLIIGLVQGVAILRGISRSGSTISAGLLLGLSKEAAAAVSFLMSLPAVGGALLLLSLEGGGGAPLGATLVVSGVLVSFVVGLSALTFLVRVIRAGKLYAFAPYCWAVGLVALCVEFFK